MIFGLGPEWSLKSRLKEKVFFFFYINVKISTAVDLDKSLTHIKLPISLHAGALISELPCYIWTPLGPRGSSKIVFVYLQILRAEINLKHANLSLAMVFIIDGCSFHYAHTLSKSGISIS